MTASRVGVLWVAAWLSVAACGDKKSADSTPGMSKASLKGRVYSADTGKPVKGVTIVDASGATAKTDASGVFEMQRERMVSQVSIDGKDYAESHKEVPASDVYLDVPIKRVDVTKEFDPAKEATLAVKDGAQVDIPANALVTRANAKPAGQVTARLTSVDVKSEVQLSALPGAGRARSGKETGQISMQGAFDLSAEDEKGEPLTTDKQKDISAAFPAGASTKTELDTFSFNTKTSEWEKEGTATLDKDKGVYRAKVKHLSWWAIGDFVDSLSCVRACVEGEDEKPAAGARVVASGVDYASVLSTFADDKGCFALDAKAGASIAIRAVTADGDTASKTVTVSQTQLSAADDPKACEDLGTLGFGQPDAGTKVEALACPLGTWSFPVEGEGTCDGTTGALVYTIAEAKDGTLTVTETLDNLMGETECGGTTTGTATYKGNELSLHFPDDLMKECTQDNVQTFVLDAACTSMSTEGDVTRTNCASCDKENLCVGCGDVSCTSASSAPVELVRDAIR